MNLLLVGISKLSPLFFKFYLHRVQKFVEKSKEAKKKRSKEPEAEMLAA